MSNDNVIQFPTKLKSVVQMKEQRLAEIEKENLFIKEDMTHLTQDMEHLQVWLNKNIEELKVLLAELAVAYGLENNPQIDFEADFNINPIIDEE